MVCVGWNVSLRNIRVEASDGNLDKVTDREGKQTTYTYNDEHGLRDIIDPRGVRAIRNEYDADGRLVKNIDADDKEIVYTHHLATNEEVITDRTGEWVQRF